ncbi:bifunctional tetrahydrofolate synthase/dihydrofolate synthase [Neptuniibacter halophilus]|uniref:bifunctional tetrahydrofolate synthase/dihydrofolate synthase n=1 Tax=Neptuniibacter halophilus TaxID=651666 RepID=UPI00257387DE|nr:bifunctional tetrahydrofolate synthase/dihydrofolate synthase [Neptuniibacter halophilus]
MKTSLSEWLTWMEQCHPAEIELGLERVSRVAESLQLDLSASTVVTIAGTNGKGSTLTFLNRIYREAGYRVGAYTSPHFIDYNERVQINGVNASDQQLCDAFQKIDQARGDIPLTYFEFGTLAALVIFSAEKPDLVLLEVGLGGRLDAVNIIDPDIAVVTTVAIDHVDWLGDDRNKIGYEKAGIFRAGRPAVCGDLDPPPSVAEYAAQIGAQLYQSGTHFSITADENGWNWFAQGEPEPVISQLPLPALPLQNAATALQAVQLIPLPVTPQQIRDGIARAQMTGRMQRLEKNGRIYWLDVAHNPEAAGLLAQRIRALPGCSKLLLGMLADKDCRQVLSLLAPEVESLYLADLQGSRAQTAGQLAGMLPEGCPAQQFSSVTAALQALKIDTNPGDNVIIAGSFFTVSEALQALEKDR